MIPVLDAKHACIALTLAINDLPAGVSFKELSKQVRNGESIVWMEGDDTIMVTSASYEGKTLFIDLLWSASAGAISRNWIQLLEFMRFSGLRYLRCSPAGIAQARLYSWFGFERCADGYMLFDIKKQEVMH